LKNLPFFLFSFFIRNTCKHTGFWGSRFLRKRKKGKISSKGGELHHPSRLQIQTTTFSGMRTTKTGRIIAVIGCSPAGHGNSHLAGHSWLQNGPSSHPKIIRLFVLKQPIS
jgi:hypothetical protein